jgi:sugar phosphate isomerase/epimerase
MAEPRIYSCSWTLLPLMGTIDAARFSAEHGLAGLEINCDPVDFWPGLGAEAMLAELGAIAAGEGIGYTLYGPAMLNPASALPRERALHDDLFARCVDIAQRLGSPVICTHPGIVSELFSLERGGVPFATERFDREALARDAWRRAVETIARWADVANAAGLAVMVENEVHTQHTAAPTAASLAAMVRAAGRPNVKVNFDSGHAYVGAGLAEEFAALEPLIAHLHLNDNARAVSEHLPLGEGKVDFPSIAGFLASVDAALVLELYAPERPIEATLASRDYLLALLAPPDGRANRRPA